MENGWQSYFGTGNKPKFFIFGGAGVSLFVLGIVASTFGKEIFIALQQKAGIAIDELVSGVSDNRFKLAATIDLDQKPKKEVIAPVAPLAVSLTKNKKSKKESIALPVQNIPAVQSLIAASSTKESLLPQVMGTEPITASLIDSAQSASDPGPQIDSHAPEALVNTIIPHQLSSSKVVISEIQIGGETTADEFIELYNGTDTSIDLTGWSIKKKSSSGAEYSLVAESRMKGKIIPAKSYYLLVNESGYAGGVEPDVRWAKSNTIASDNTVLLYSDTILMDKVGFGEAKDFEGMPALNPDKGNALTRINSDTDNNLVDFVLAAPTPRQ